jgi:hypothetical protein
MKFHDFAKLISDEQSPTILVEGRRTISADAAATAGRLAGHLAERFPNLLFRSGNASGSDEAFAAGVLAVAPDRMQIIAPYAGHRRKQRHPLARYDSPESLSADALEAIQTMTVAATPANKGLMKWYQRGGKLGSQAACLIRNTMNESCRGFRAACKAGCGPVFRRSGRSGGRRHRPHDPRLPQHRVAGVLPEPLGNLVSGQLVRIDQPVRAACSLRGAAAEERPGPEPESLHAD